MRKGDKAYILGVVSGFWGGHSSVVSLRGTGVVMKGSGRRLVTGLVWSRPYGGACCAVRSRGFSRAGG